MCRKIKLVQLVNRLEKILNEHGNLEVRIDNDPENGWYDLEKIQVKKDKETQEKFLNLQSSNEA